MIPLNSFLDYFPFLAFRFLIFFHFFILSPYFHSFHHLFDYFSDINFEHLTFLLIFLPIQTNVNCCFAYIYLIMDFHGNFFLKSYLHYDIFLIQFIYLKTNFMDYVFFFFFHYYKLFNLLVNIFLSSLRSLTLLNIMPFFYFHLDSFSFYFIVYIFLESIFDNGLFYFILQTVFIS